MASCLALGVDQEGLVEDCQVQVVEDLVVSFRLGQEVALEACFLLELEEDQQVVCRLEELVALGVRVASFLE